MSILYLECAMGAAGDMLTAALLELHPDPDAFLVKLNNCGIPGALIGAENSVKCGISGTHMKVLLDGDEEHGHHHEHEHHHHHEHMNVAEIDHVIHHLNVSDKVKADVKNVFMLLAEAESKVHGTTIEQIHFHEIGTMDAVADITAVCMLLDELAPDNIYASAVNVGGGTVKCAHGVLPVPAPATAELLKGVPFYFGTVKSELCTPTGAALLKYFVDSFGDMPVMTVQKIGYGMGKKDFDSPNCVRAFLGSDNSGSNDVVVMSCNIDDMTGEEIGFATEMLLENSALDVWTAPITMKKSRPAFMLNCLCKEADIDRFAELIFKYTTTIGIRYCKYSRFCLERDTITKDTEFGPVRVKRVHGYGVTRAKIEYDDVAVIARDNNVSVSDVRNSIK